VVGASGFEWVMEDKGWYISPVPTYAITAMTEISKTKKRRGKTKRERTI
jgi:hypothetical protein